MNIKNLIKCLIITQLAFLVYEVTINALDVQNTDMRYLGSFCIGLFGISISNIFWPIFGDTK